VLGALASADEGGMTSTYLAEGPAPGKRVVVKLLPWERLAGNSDAARTLFEQEMTRLAAVTHPNVVSIIDAGFVDEGAYIAIEYIPGASLETVLRALGPLDLRYLGPIVRDVARGLAYLHARGIVHRDIKPGNILVQLEGLEPQAPLTREAWERAQFVRSVVIDLGIAAEAQGTRVENEDGLVGTPGYLAPEIARGLDLVTPALDVYALAVVVLEALTGVNPFLEGDPELPTLLVRHGTMSLPLETLPESAQRPALLHLLAEAGSLDPRGRPTMRDFLARWIAALK
jgi:serine/threonine-protein kinase